MKGAGAPSSPPLGPPSFSPLASEKQQERVRRMVTGNVEHRLHLSHPGPQAARQLHGAPAIDTAAAAPSPRVPQKRWS